MEKGLYSAMDIAKYVIDKCIDDEMPISNLQLQKILYYLQVYFIKHEGIPLFEDEIEAWQFGPVIPEVYYEYCGFGGFEIQIKQETDILLENKEKSIIDSIVDEKRKMEPWELVKDTHDKSKAWYARYNALGRGSIISKDLMGRIG